MVIVVVIIGLLVAALIPRVKSVQARANDTRRKADLSKIASALWVFYADNRSYNALSGMYSTLELEAALTTSGRYLTLMPKDTWKTTSNHVVYDEGWNPHEMTWGYGFLVLPRNGKPATAVVLVARVETHASANFVFDFTYASWGNYLTPWDRPTQATLVNVSQYENLCRRVSRANVGSEVFLPWWDCLASEFDISYIRTQ